MKKAPQSDKQLIEQIAAGNPEALGQFTLRYQDMALSLAYRNTQNWTDAEDIVQEAFIRVFKSANRYKGQSGIKTWLYRIVVNLCIDHQRKNKSSISLDTMATDLVSQSTPDHLEAQETAALVQKAVYELPERQRIALILHRYENLSHSEISESTGWSRSTIESLLVRAYDKLRKKLEKVEFQ
jgi:RNA polymerase sigma-70 factor, ECF subfamily